MCAIVFRKFGRAYDEPLHRFEAHIEGLTNNQQKSAHFGLKYDD
jgi:hypothetical protein